MLSHGLAETKILYFCYTSYNFTLTTISALEAIREVPLEVFLIRGILPIILVN